MGPIQPAGLSPASIWDPDALAPPIRPVPILAPELDPSTGERLSLTVSADPTVVAIGLALRTVRASGAAVTDDGTLLGDIRKNTPDAPARIEFEIGRVLQPFVDAGLIRIDRVDVSAGPSFGTRATATVHLTLLRSAKTVSIPV